MDKKELEERIKNLDPKSNKSLIVALNKHLGSPLEDEDTAQNGQSTDPFAEMFKKAVDELNRKYVRGTINHICKYHPSLYRKTKEVENKLNEVWKAGLEGNVNLEQFRDVLKEWYLLYSKGIEIYKKERKEKANDSIKQTVGS